ncbi:hypothetical protein, partial [Paenibacillus zanthoxyli]|uniref:hypothetical protein n=1 Tax=Paenibacillus zanthoxyli TaxID=369399 RepID=UPI000567B1A4
FELIIGLFLLSEPLTLANLRYQLAFLVQTWLLYIALTPLAAFIAIVVRKSILCAIASAGGGIMSMPLGVVSSKYITLSPWLIPYLFSYYPLNIPDYPVWEPGLLVSGILILLSMGLGLYIYTKKDLIYE